MQITNPIPQEIGTNSGVQNDGVIIGEVSHENFNAEAYYSFAHEITYAYQDNDNNPISNSNTWSPFTAKFNDKTACEPFNPLDPSNPTPTLYIAIEEGQTGLTFNVTTAGTGVFTFKAFYNSENDGYIEIPDHIFSAQFFRQTGLATLFFEPPTDWATDYIGNIDIPPQRWLRIEIATGTIITQPEITGAWDMSEVLEESPPPIVVENPPFVNPYVDLLPGNGDTLYLSSTSKPYGMVISYETPLAEGNVSYVYSKVDGTFETLAIVSDTSEGFTYNNEQEFTVNALSTVLAGADSATVEALTGDGYIKGVVDTLPTTTNDIISIGLSSSQTGAMDYELAIQKPAGAAVYQRIEAGVVVDTSTVEATPGDIISVFRYENKIYYKVNGLSVFDEVDVPETTDNLYGRVFATNTTAATQDIEIYMWDWSNRLAIGLELTFNNVEFTNTPSTDTQSLPGHYYIQFVSPDDFASLTALLSKTGVSGYELGIVSEFTTLPANNIELMDQKVLTMDSELNVFFPAGAQTIINNMVLDTQNPENITVDETFILITKNTVGMDIQSITFEPSDNDSGIFDKVIEKVGMTEFILIHADGSSELTVGTPSYVFMSS